MAARIKNKFFMIELMDRFTVDSAVRQNAGNNELSYFFLSFSLSCASHFRPRKAESLFLAINSKKILIKQFILMKWSR